MHRAPRPTRPDKARRLGYKAKQVWNRDNLLELESVQNVTENMIQLNNYGDSFIAFRNDFHRDTLSTVSPWGGVDASALLPRVAPMVSLELRFYDHDTISPPCYERVFCDDNNHAPLIHMMLSSTTWNWQLSLSCPHKTTLTKAFPLISISR